MVTPPGARPADDIVLDASPRSGGPNYTAAFRWNYPDGIPSLLYFAWGDDFRYVLDVAQRVSNGSCVRLEETALEVGASTGSVGVIPCPLCEFVVDVGLGGPWSREQDAELDKGYTRVYRHLVEVHPDDTKSKCWWPFKELGPPSR